MHSLTRRQRNLVLWAARLALIVVTFQLAALDHHFHIADLQGVEGTSSHVMHCHGSSAGCSGAGSAVAVASVEGYTLPFPAILRLEPESPVVKPANVALVPEAEPPRL